jgi:hypothetical protein
MAHLKAVHAWSGEAGGLGGLWLDYFFASGRPASIRGYAGFLKGDLAVVGGVFPIHKGLGSAVMIPSPVVNGAKTAFVRFSRDTLFDIYDQMALHRMQCIVRSDDMKARGFAKLIGFVGEGTLKRYGPNQEDHEMMVWNGRP